MPDTVLSALCVLSYIILKSFSLKELAGGKLRVMTLVGDIKYKEINITLRMVVLVPTQSSESARGRAHTRADGK